MNIWLDCQITCWLMASLEMDGLRAVPKRWTTPIHTEKSSDGQPCCCWPREASSRSPFGLAAGAYPRVGAVAECPGMEEAWVARARWGWAIRISTSS